MWLRCACRRPSSRLIASPSSPSRARWREEGWITIDALGGEIERKVLAVLRDAGQAIDEDEDVIKPFSAQSRSQFPARTYCSFDQRRC